MAIAVDTGNVATKQTTSSTPTFTSFVVGSGSNRILLVGIALNSATATITSVVFNGSETLTAVPNTAHRGNTSQYTEWYYRLAPSVTTADIVVTLSASADVQMVACTCTGVDQVTGVSGGVGNEYLFANASSDVTSAVGDLVMDLVYYSLGSNPTVDASQTILAQPAPSFFGWGSSYEAGASSISMDWTTDSGSATQSAFNIKQASGGGAGGGTPFFTTLGAMRVS